MYEEMKYDVFDCIHMLYASYIFGGKFTFDILIFLKVPLSESWFCMLSRATIDGSTNWPPMIALVMIRICSSIRIVYIKTSTTFAMKQYTYSINITINYFCYETYLKNIMKSVGVRPLESQNIPVYIRQLVNASYVFCDIIMIYEL